MKNLSSLKKMMVVMKGFSTIIAVVGALCVILIVFFALIGFKYHGPEIKSIELFACSCLVFFYGVMAEQVFENLLYKQEVQIGT